MSKVFTITKGLENMGAIKTGGQGSVYKARRIGEIISAIKILPTPIHSESEDDKNFISFQNEVNKLKRVNAEPNANVVSILGSGVTDSGSFPYIEMEYIEGPDLGELLKPPHDPIFSIQEVLKVATHLSNALAHCHKANVKHGDIKSNNVKFNIHTGNYILLDFGLSLLSDEERRTSLRHAGAIEFMAPEQNNGELLFQTDIYSFGIIIFELLAGAVPFPLKDNGETSRNEIMMSHLELPPPDILALREAAMPDSWDEKTRAAEAELPQWLVYLVYKCLEKDPHRRYEDGMELYTYISRNLVTLDNNAPPSGNNRFLKEENERLKREKEQLQALLHKYPSFQQPGNSRHTVPAASKKPSILKNILIVMLTLVIGVLLYHIYTNGKEETISPSKVHAAPPDSVTITQLRTARQHMVNGNLTAAISIFNELIPKENPEALFQVANLALKNQYNGIDCNKSIDYLVRSSDGNYAPAKRLLGYLYTREVEELEKSSYTRCKMVRDIAKGSSLLMEAMLLGDAEAASLLNKLNERINRR